MPKIGITEDNEQIYLGAKIVCEKFYFPQVNENNIQNLDGKYDKKYK